MQKHTVDYEKYATNKWFDIEKWLALTGIQFLYHYWNVTTILHFSNLQHKDHLINIRSMPKPLHLELNNYTYMQMLKENKYLSSIGDIEIISYCWKK